jgi:hypothetical protein
MENTNTLPELSLHKASVSSDGVIWKTVEGFGVYKNRFLTPAGNSFPHFKAVVEEPKYEILRPCLWFCKGDKVEVKDLHGYFLQNAIDKLVEDEFIKLV